VINLIHKQNMTITRAAQQAQVNYPTAKAINKVYREQRRVYKKRAGFDIHN
jgi:hypothetical protein